MKKKKKSGKVVAGSVGIAASQALFQFHNLSDKFKTWSEGYDRFLSLFRPCWTCMRKHSLSSSSEQAPKKLEPNRSIIAHRAA